MLTNQKLQTASLEETRQIPSKPQTKKAHDKSHFWKDVESTYFGKLEPTDVNNIIQAVRQASKADLKSPDKQAKQSRDEQGSASTDAFMQSGFSAKPE